MWPKCAGVDAGIPRLLASTGLCPVTTHSAPSFGVIAQTSCDHEASPGNS